MTAKKPSPPRTCACGCGEQVEDARPNRLYIDSTHKLVAQKASRKPRPTKGRRRLEGMPLGQVRVLAALAQSLPDREPTAGWKRHMAKMAALGVKAEPVCFFLPVLTRQEIAERAGIHPSAVRAALGKKGGDGLWAKGCVWAVHDRGEKGVCPARTMFEITPYGLYALGEAMKALGGWLPRPQPGPHGRRTRY